MSPISFIIPTRDRPEELLRTLALIDAYPVEMLGNEPAEVVVVDNASRISIERVVEKRAFSNAQVQVITLKHNISTAARNMGAQRATGEWIVMLDDDSAPISGDFARILDGYSSSLSSNVAAIGGEIILPSGKREAGGFPEVVVGCGCAIRRQAFLDVGGYDESFGYYAEEYDLCAKFIGAGYQIVHTDAIGFEHRKIVAGRDFSEILFRLVRNNAWVLSRYAPASQKQDALEAMFNRYRLIALKEGVVEAFDRALVEFQETAQSQPSVPLTDEQWLRFSGACFARSFALGLQSKGQTRVARVGLVGHGKGADVIEQELVRAGVVVDDASLVKVIATLSPGPVLDARDEFPDALVPWSPRRVGAVVSERAILEQ